jgi:hypothetical protein
MHANPKGWLHHSTGEMVSIWKGQGEGSAGSEGRTVNPRSMIAKPRRNQSDTNQQSFTRHCRSLNHYATKLWIFPDDYPPPDWQAVRQYVN